MKVSRRKFLGGSAAAVVVAGTMARGKVFGANDRIAVAVMGVGGRGGGHVDTFLDHESSQVVGLCDIDQRALARRAKTVTEKQGSAPKEYVDIREMVVDDSIDAISIATPNHWHTLGAVWACENGKHVYVEKPLSWCFDEGIQLAAAAKKYNRIVQHGTQQRSDPGMIRDCKLMHEDKVIGDIIMSRGTVYKNGNRGSIGRGHEADPPEHLDYDLWLGPAPNTPYLAKENGRGLFIPYNWHWFWDWGNGEIGNQGVHQMDAAVWTMNKGLPVKVYSAGGRFGLDDDGQTPNLQSTTFTYADGTLLEFEVRNLGSFDMAQAGNCTNAAFGTTGYWVQGKGFFDYKKQEPIQVEGERPQSAGTFGNFLNAVRSGKEDDNFAPPEVGHISCAHIHLGNIAYRSGQSLDFDPANGQFIGDGSDQANRMLKRNYREPFVVPTIT